MVIVNPAEVYGPNDTEMVTAGTLADFAKSSPVLGCSEGTSVVPVDDVAIGVIRALEIGRSGERYLLGGDNLTVKKLAPLTLELLDQKKRIVIMPNALIRGLARALLALHVLLDELEAHPELAVLCQERARYFLNLYRDRSINTGSSLDSAVVPCISGNSHTCAKLAENLLHRGILVHPILAPAVPESPARLRFFVTATHAGSTALRSASCSLKRT